MNAIEFVKKFGIFGAKEYLSGSIFYKNNLMVFTSEDNLKQIVDAWELVEKFGGIDKSKKILKKAYDSCSQIILDSRKNIETTWNDLNNAINLVEQCQ